MEPTVEGYGCTAEFDYYFGPSPLINDNEELVKTARRAAAEEMGEEALIPLKKMTGAEDFSVYTEHVPGVFGYLGCRNEEKASQHRIIIRHSMWMRTFCSTAQDLCAVCIRLFGITFCQFSCLQKKYPML